MDSREPLVSVVVMAYNIERYISEALESILMQRAPFDYEIVVGEDCSTDNTRGILKSYAERYPGRFKLILRERNLGLVANFRDALDSCSGKYIAMCDGDDYWTDPEKLRKQVGFLESRPEYGIVFTDADVYYEEEKRFVRGYDRRIRKTVPQGDVFSALLFGPNPYRVSTSLYRNSLLAEYKKIITMRDFYVNDFPLWVSLARRSLVGYIPQSTAVYRIRARSVSHLETLADVIRFRRSKYRICLFLAEQFNIRPDVKRLRKKYLRDVIGECAVARNLPKLRHYTGSLFLGLMILARQYFVEWAYQLKKGG